MFAFVTRCVDGTYPVAATLLNARLNSSTICHPSCVRGSGTVTDWKLPDAIREYSSVAPSPAPTLCGKSEPFLPAARSAVAIGVT